MSKKGAATGLEELQERLYNLYIVNEYVKSYMDSTRVIVLTDSSKINKDLLTVPLQMMYDLLYQYGMTSYNSVLIYSGIGIKFLDIYKQYKKYKLKHWNGGYAPFHRGLGVNLGGYDSDPLTTLKCEQLGININNIEDKGLILRYIENTDVEEAIFNTRMEIYNLTHRNRDIEHLHREIEMLKSTKSKTKEECCDKLESRIERLEINLSRVEGMVRELEPTQIVHTQLSPTSPRRTANKANKNTPRKTKKNSAMSLMPRHLYYGRPELPE